VTVANDSEPTAPADRPSDIAATLAERSAGLVVEELPTAGRARIIADWSTERPRLGAIAADRLRRFVAELIGSAAGPLVAGARGTGPAQLAHRWPDGTVVWSLTPAEHGWRIDGQLLIDDLDGPWQVMIGLDDRDLETVAVDELGEFHSPVVLDEPRIVVLDLIGPDDVVRCGPIELDAAAEGR
jgi:hypothetical protein